MTGTTCWGWPGCSGCASCASADTLDVCSGKNPARAGEGNPMQFKSGDRVWLEDNECAVLAVDESDGTYLVWGGVGFDVDGEWVPECRVSALQGKSNLVGPLGQRMRYDNSSARRKDQPVTEGFLDYFPAAVRLAAELSRLGNEKHRGAGVPLRHARGVSADHRDCAVRHLMDADKIDSETGLVEAVAALWRCAAYVQELAERKYGWPVAPAAEFATKNTPRKETNPG